MLQRSSIYESHSSKVLLSIQRLLFCSHSKENYNSFPVYHYNCSLLIHYNLFITIYSLQLLRFSYGGYSFIPNVNQVLLDFRQSFLQESQIFESLCDFLGEDHWNGWETDIMLINHERTHEAISTFYSFLQNSESGILLDSATINNSI